MSSADIGAGARWSTEIAGALSNSKIGIICVSAENQQEPWLLFEAGALAKTLEETFVCPYLIHMRQSDLVPGPLTQFQSKVANKEGTFDLVSNINRVLGSDALPDERLLRLFERSWPDLEKKLSAVPIEKTDKVINRDQSEILSEVLETVRSLSRRIPEPPPELSPEEKAKRARRMREISVRNKLSRLEMDESGSAHLQSVLRHLPDSALEELNHILYNPIRGKAETLEAVVKTFGKWEVLANTDESPVFRKG